MHGARRSEGYIPVPEKLASHLFYTAHNNPTGLLQRDSIACRKEHRNSPMPHLTAGFDDNGNPVARSGHMVPCRKHSDCYACGRHPLTGQFFQCQHRHKFYDTVRTTSGSILDPTPEGIEFLNLTSASASAFDIDMEEGALTKKTGVCVDLDSSMNQGCGNEVAAKIKDGIIGCDMFQTQLLVASAHAARVLSQVHGRQVGGQILVRSFGHGVPLPSPFSTHHFYRTHFVSGLSLISSSFLSWQVKHGDLDTVQTEGNLFCS